MAAFPQEAAPSARLWARLILILHDRHITRNLSNLRPRDDYRSSQNDRELTVRHRAPDAAILDHERKRKVEVQCLELQDELEEKGVAPDEVEKQVDELRQRLLRQGQAEPERGSIKAYQRHELLAAKAVDNAKFERAMGIRKGYVEGDSINKEKQEELRQQRQMEREQRDVDLAERKRQYEAGLEERKVQEAKQRADRAEAMEKQRQDVAVRAREREAHFRDLQRDRENDGRARDTGRSAPRVRNDLVDSYRPGRDGGRRSRSPPARRSNGRDRSISRSRSRSRSRSDSPPRKRRATSESRSPSPRRRRQRSYSTDSRGRSPSRSLSRSRSPPRTRSVSPPRTIAGIKGRATRQRTRSPSRSRSPPRRRAPFRSVSRSPLRKVDERGRSRSRSPARKRSPSRSGSEDMDVESD